MIPQNLSMCRESRKILLELERQAQKYNLGTIVTISQIQITDQLVLKYFTAPILNTICSKLKNMRTRSSKHFNIEYWIPILEQMFNMNTGAKRENSVIGNIDMKNTNQSFQWISEYMITDYSLGDAEMIYNIGHNYTEKMVRDAITIAIQNNVYNIHYINAILERSSAVRKLEQQKVNKLVSKIESSESILNRPKVQHSAIDIATMQYNWQKLQEDMELERRFDELMK